MQFFALALPALLAIGVLANPLPEPKPDLVIETVIHDNGQSGKVVSESVTETDFDGETRIQYPILTLLIRKPDRVQPETGSPELYIGETWSLSVAIVLHSYCVQSFPRA